MIIDFMQTIGAAEEAVFKGTLVALTVTSCIRFVYVELLSAKRQIRKEREIYRM